MNRCLNTQKVKRERDVSKFAKLCEKVLFSLLFFFGIGALVYGFYFLVFFSPFLQVRHLEVSGQFHNLTEAEVKSALHVKEGERLFLLNVSDVQTRLLKFPWVKAATVRRRLPDTLWVSVEEYQPHALLAADKLYFMDEKGIIFKQMDAKDPKDFPLLTGMVDSVKGKLSVFEVKPKLVQAALQLIKQFELSQLATDNAISEVHYDPLQGFSILTRDFPMQLLIGKTDFADKLQRLDQFWQNIAAEKKRVRYMALIADDQLVVKFASI